MAEPKVVVCGKRTSAGVHWHCWTRMSAMAHWRTLASELGMSALPLKADMLSVSIDGPLSGKLKLMERIQTNPARRGRGNSCSRSIAPQIFIVQFLPVLDRVFLRLGSTLLEPSLSRLVQSRAQHGVLFWGATR